MHIFVAPAFRLPFSETSCGRGVSSELITDVVNRTSRSKISCLLRRDFSMGLMFIYACLQEKKKSRSKRWLWKNSKWVKNVKLGYDQEVDPFILSKMRLLLTRYNSSWEIGKKLERKASDWQKEDEWFNAVRRKNKVRGVPQEEQRNYPASKRTAVHSL
jgi:hypothetical protein